MPAKIRGLSYSNVVATAAVFIALGGGAYAVTAEKNSVTSKSIKTGAVKSADVKNNALKGIDVKDDSLTGADIVESTLTGIQGVPGPTAAGVLEDAPAITFVPDDADLGPSATVSVPTAGRILALANGALRVTCSGGTSVLIGLFLDGTLIPDTGAIVVLSDGFTPFNQSGITAAAVAPGDHEITIGAQCEGDPTGLTVETLSLTGILLGQ